MKEKLQKFIDSQELVAIFDNYNETDRFAVGFIIAVNDLDYIIEEITPLGKYNGLSFRLIEDIIKLEYDNEYIDDISILFNFHKEKRNDSIHIKDSLLVSLFEFARANNKICNIQLCDSELEDAVGFIDSIDEINVNIKMIQKNGRCDGNSIIQLQRISLQSV